MALEIECRNTFIHLKEECEDMAGSSKVRAHSSPPGQLRPTSFGMETTNVVSRKSDGQTPTTACGSSPTSPMSWDDSPGSQEGPEHVPVLAEFFPLLPSQGSLGHPEVCRRPCIYFIAGNCENGRACAYCHIEHTEKTPKLDKRQRTIMQGSLLEPGYT
ncbi:unnamed protein product [Symbiodinium natans]|uniref:C3H1-type domain-containing protein n=1 Tax=Symbiodinium natans TaxID=878477 RepID=A0A812M8I6_9DINO|nr:unnamed protein product [Symbiodinium natans]